MTEYKRVMEKYLVTLIIGLNATNAIIMLLALLFFISKQPNNFTNVKLSISLK
jgi:hypothetical protein